MGKRKGKKIWEKEMGRGKLKGKPTGHRSFSSPDEIVAGTSTWPSTFRRKEAEQESEEEEVVEEKPVKRKGTEGIIQIENPNLAKAKNVKAKDVDMNSRTELSRREREEIGKQKARKTEQVRKDLERLVLIRQQRAEAAKKREEKAGVVLLSSKESKKAEARK